MKFKYCTEPREYNLMIGCLNLINMGPNEFIIIIRLVAALLVEAGKLRTVAVLPSEKSMKDRSLTLAC